jgi:hypothetical protein
LPLGGGSASYFAHSAYRETPLFRLMFGVSLFCCIQKKMSDTGKNIYKNNDLDADEDFC